MPPLSTWKVSQKIAVGPARSAAIVGGGLSGLTAAFRLQCAGWSVKVFEAEEVVGGRVQTVTRDGYLLDTGASALTSSYHAYRELAKELGLESDIVFSAQQVGVYARHKIHLLDLEHVVRSGLTTKLLSSGAKLRLVRLAYDVFRARQRGQIDFVDLGNAAPLDTETIQQYARRALSDEIDDYLCSPIARTMLIAESNQISKVELFSGLANIIAAKMYALRGGQGRFTQVLSERLNVSLRHTVTRVSDQGDHVVVESTGGFMAGRSLPNSEKFDACVIACPLPVAATICPDRKALLDPLNSALSYTKAITVAVATHVAPQCPAFLIQLPACEDSEIALVFVEHNKCADRTPPGRGLFGCDWAADASAGWFDRPDAQIAARTEQTIYKLFPELRGQVAFTHVTRWQAALPYTKVGAYRHIAQFNAVVDPTSRIQFAGDYMSGAGQNTAVEYGNRAAQNLLR